MELSVGRQIDGVIIRDYQPINKGICISLYWIIDKYEVQKDGTEMKVVSKITRLLSPDELGEMTEGQEADYIAAEMNEEAFPDYHITETLFRCPKCGQQIIVQED